MSPSQHAPPTFWLGALHGTSSLLCRGDERDRVAGPRTNRGGGRSASPTGARPVPCAPTVQRNARAAALVEEERVEPTASSPGEFYQSKGQGQALEEVTGDNVPGQALWLAFHFAGGCRGVTDAAGPVNAECDVASRAACAR